MREILFEFQQVLKNAGLIVLLFVLSKFSQTFGFLPFIPEELIYGCMILMAIYMFTKYTKADIQMLILLGYLVLNIYLCKPDTIFNSWMRLGLFVILMVCVGPLLQNETLRDIRHKCLQVTMSIITGLSIISFFCYFFEINYMWLEYESEYNTAGTFGGLFSHSMLLGLIAGASAVFSTYKALETEGNQKTVFIVITLICLATVFLSASRSALLCSIAGVLLTLQKASNNNQHFLKIATIGMLITAVTYPLWGEITEDVVEKTEKNMEMGGFTASREDKWNARIEEFKSSPLVGIGFAAVDPELDDVSHGGIIEPGTSWLAVLSMTGIIGLILFLSVFYKAYTACNKMTQQEDALYLGLLALFSVHMMAEGYVFAAGSFQCFLLWLIIGCCYDRKYETEDIFIQ